MKDKNGIIIFADGSSLGNPGPGGWGAIVKIESQVTELGGALKHTTNNRMELTAAIKALEFISFHKIKKDQPIFVYTDSAYVINGITKWVYGWQKNNWKTSKKEAVINQELWEELFAITRGVSVSWKQVKGHAGIPGNERVDEIATNFSSGTVIDLYVGDSDAYPIDLTVSPIISEKKNTKSKSPKGKGFSYLSLIDGKLIRHETWVECEARVKGARGAKFKKAMNLADEVEIKKSWNIL